VTSAGFVVGPIAGGFIAQHIGLKYIFIIMSALCGVAALIGIPCLKETYAPVIRLRLGKLSSDSEKVAQTLLYKNESIWRKLWLNLSRPVILLSHSFICFILSLYLAM
jgi:MFS family permease